MSPVAPNLLVTPGDGDGVVEKGDGGDGYRMDGAESELGRAARSSQGNEG